jgi:hypothetical protein
MSLVCRGIEIKLFNSETSYYQFCVFPYFLVYVLLTSVWGAECQGYLGEGQEWRGGLGDYDRVILSESGKSSLYLIMG